jgi:hypothetical protein
MNSLSTTRIYNHPNRAAIYKVQYYKTCEYIPYSDAMPFISHLTIQGLRPNRHITATPYLYLQNIGTRVVQLRTRHTRTPRTLARIISVSQTPLYRLRGSQVVQLFVPPPRQPQPCPQDLEQATNANNQGDELADGAEAVETGDVVPEQGELDGEDALDADEVGEDGPEAPAFRAVEPREARLADRGEGVDCGP